MKNRLYQIFVKRFMDIILSFFALVFLFPIFILVAFLVKVKLGSPVIFKQLRPGINQTTFTMYKFRTMKNLTDSDGKLLPDGKRLTKFGKILRSSSLDEIPELFNILKGDMSFVGPRPQLIKDLAFMTDTQKIRQTIKPGLTGYAQVNGRNSISWEEKLQLDLYYVKNVSLYLDIKILFITLFKTIKKSDIQAKGFDTAEDFGDYLLRMGKITEVEYNEILKKVTT